jgi:hypothetical protein
MRSTDWDERLTQLAYDYSWLASATIDAALDIPHSQMLQFRRIRSKLCLLSERGHDIECMTSEQLYGATLVAPQKGSIFWTRCEFDIEITDTLFNQIRKNFPLLKAWYTTNLTANNPLLVSIPLGLNDYCGYTPFHQIAGNLEYFQKSGNLKMREGVLCCMNPNTHLSSRLTVIENARKRSDVLVIPPDTSIAGFKRYLHLLRTSNFVLCPRGNGIDTHRFWEALYMGCIPICLKQDLLPCQVPMPVLALESWSQLADVDLEAVSGEIRSKRWDMRSLCIDYWVDDVLDCLTRTPVS